MKQDTAEKKDINQSKQLNENKEKCRRIICTPADSEVPTRVFRRRRRRGDRVNVLPKPLGAARAVSHP